MAYFKKMNSIAGYWKVARQLEKFSPASIAQLREVNRSFYSNLSAPSRAEVDAELARKSIYMDDIINTIKDHIQVIRSSGDDSLETIRFEVFSARPILEFIYEYGDRTMFYPIYDRVYNLGIGPLVELFLLVPTQGPYNFFSKHINDGLIDDIIEYIRLFPPTDMTIILNVLIHSLAKLYRSSNIRNKDLFAGYVYVDESGREKIKGYLKQLNRIFEHNR
jgi:hypothetical protein